MDLGIIITLLGGLSLFLYGMQMMSTGLEAIAGNSMKKILEKLTANRFIGVAVGAGITALIQSSSATTVMVVGFVNSGLMTLKQAVWIIMGANVGTTITGQLIALDIGALAPIFSFVGVVFIVFVKKAKFHDIGHIVAGLGILFIGMGMMSSAVKPLREVDAFINIMTQFSNPLFGIIAGALFTAIIQSSSASVGILQALAVSGVIGLPSAVYVLFGQNIGTCITAVLASVGTTRNAKRTTIIHMLFNVIGTVIFTIVCMTTDLTGLVESFTPGNPAGQIANMHTLFNIATTILLIPFGTQLAKLATIILPEVEEEKEEAGMKLEYISHLYIPSEHKVGNSLLIIDSIEKEVNRMFEMANKNVEASFDAIINMDSEKIKKVSRREEYIDYLNKEISMFISSILPQENNTEDLKLISAYYKILGNVERIGDHAMNICEYTNILSEKNIKFSQIATEEIIQMKKVSMLAMDVLAKYRKGDDDKWLGQIKAFEQEMDDMKVKYKQNQIERMQSSTCSNEASIIYSELLTDFERIGDHILNIGQEIVYGIDD